MQVALMVCASLAWQSQTEPTKERARDGIDFWGTGSPKSNVPRPKSRSKAADIRQPASNIRHLESVFAEPIRMPDGRFAIYVPPKQVLEFLEEPTRESARGYLAWQDERARKMSAALKILEELKEEHASDDARLSNVQGPKSNVATDAPRPESPAAKVAASQLKSDSRNLKARVRLTYFRQPN